MPEEPGDPTLDELDERIDSAFREAYPDVPFVWPEFERGGHGVFVLSAGQLA